MSSATSSTPPSAASPASSSAPATSSGTTVAFPGSSSDPATKTSSGSSSSPPPPASSSSSSLVSPAAASSTSPNASIVGKAVLPTNSLGASSLSTTSTQTRPLIFLTAAQSQSDRWTPKRPGNKAFKGGDVGPGVALHDAALQQMTEVLGKEIRELMKAQEGVSSEKARATQAIEEEKKRAEGGFEEEWREERQILEAECAEILKLGSSRTYGMEWARMRRRKQMGRDMGIDTGAEFAKGQMQDHRRWPDVEYDFAKAQMEDKLLKVVKKMEKADREKMVKMEVKVNNAIKKKNEKELQFLRGEYGVTKIELLLPIHGATIPWAPPLKIKIKISKPGVPSSSTNPANPAPLDPPGCDPNPQTSGSADAGPGPAVAQLKRKREEEDDGGKGKGKAVGGEKGKGKGKGKGGKKSGGGGGGGGGVSLVGV